MRILAAFSLCGSLLIVCFYCQKPFYDPFIVLLLTLVHIIFPFLVSIIGILFVLGNLIEDPSVNDVMLASSLKITLILSPCIFSFLM